MQTQHSFEKCAQFVNSQASYAPGLAAPSRAESPRLTVTIARQSGSGAHCIADYLARFLQARSAPDCPPWSVFDRNLVEQVLQDHHLPARLARYMPEDSIPNLADAFEELLGVHPASWSLVQQTAQTILRIARTGNAILIGRGAHVITSALPNAFHVRLVGSLEKRVEHLRESRGLSRDAAFASIQREDKGRQRYLKTYFGKELDDPLAFHLVINTDSVAYEQAATLIGEAALSYIQAPHAPVPVATPPPSERAFA